MTERLLGVNEIAKILGVAPSWLYSRTRLKGPDGIPHLKVGKYVKFRIDEVMAWIQAQNEAN